MTSLEKKLAARLLDLAADQFVNHGCNDLDLVSDAGLTGEECREVLLALHQWKDDPEARLPTPDQHYVEDWMLMRMLAGRLREDAP